jgi:hypothetical protein
MKAMMAYYYFDFSEADNQTLDSFIRSLIGQLSFNFPEMPQYLSDLYRYCRDKKLEPSTESLKRVLHAILLDIAKALVVVDALDECSNPEELVQFIGEIRSWEIADLRLLVISRKHFEGANLLEDLRPVNVSIQDELANDDISTFVRETLSNDSKLKSWPPKVKNEIETLLLSKSSGM